MGTVNIYGSKCTYVIQKAELQNILFPLLFYHNIFFLTNVRLEQFSKAIYIMLNNIKLLKKVPSSIPLLYTLPTLPQDYLNLPFFSNWIVGFTVAEGSFFIKQNNDGCFQLKQRSQPALFAAFKLVFSTKRSITVDKHGFMQLGMSSKKDIQSVINFFSFSDLHPLVGLKAAQYKAWLSDLQNSKRYKNLNFPMV